MMTRNNFLKIKENLAWGIGSSLKASIPDMYATVLLQRGDAETFPLKLILHIENVF